jgi:hypothetical protein
MVQLLPSLTLVDSPQQVTVVTISFTQVRQKRLYPWLQIALVYVAKWSY